MSSGVSQVYEYVFPAISGIQSQRTFYVTMCPLHLIPKIFLFDEEEIVPELRAQRVLNKVRVPEIARYILNNEKGYVFSALTASVDADLRFEGSDGTTGTNGLGFLHIPMSGRFVINDGQHRRAAIEMALNENPELGNETIAVVLFHDRGLKRSQQMFADLNKYAVRPSNSLGILYDHRDPIGGVTKKLAFECDAFKGVVELEKTTLSLRSRKLFTLSSVYSANRALLKGSDNDDPADLYERANRFWNLVANQFPEWKQVRDSKVSASQVRQDFIHTHGVILQAIGKVGNELFALASPLDKYIPILREIDWHRNNTKLWEGRALHNGRLSKASTSITLAANAIKNRMGIELNSEDTLLEEKLHPSHGKEL